MHGEAGNFIFGAAKVLELILLWKYFLVEICKRIWLVLLSLKLVPLRLKPPWTNQLQLGDVRVAGHKPVSRCWARASRQS